MAEDHRRGEDRSGGITKFVMAGLVPAIHAFLANKKQGVDARHKAGHDGGEDGGHMKRVSLAFLSIVLAAGVSAVHAQDKYPSKPVRVMVPFAAGSATDITIRIVGEQMRQLTGQGFVIENKPGVFGILAIEEMAKPPYDGYTLQVGNPGINVLTPIIYKDKFKIDYEKEVTMVTRLGEIPLILAATTVDFEPKTYAEFFTYAKANPGKVRYASVGVGSNNHYDTEAFAQWAGIKLQHIPNKGGGGAITNDVLRGDVHVVLVNAASSAGLAQAGKLRVLAVMADQRLPDYPNAPTFKELGYSTGKGLWSALYAPSKTPRDVLETLHRQTVQALGAPFVQESFKKQMIKATPDASIEAAAAWNKEEAAHWKKLTETVKVERTE
jgi:tripartite-type tricarboxylate transporter receptor subunit TctC